MRRRKFPAHSLKHNRVVSTIHHGKWNSSQEKSFFTIPTKVFTPLVFDTFFVVFQVFTKLGSNTPLGWPGLISLPLYLTEMWSDWLAGTLILFSSVCTFSLFPVRGAICFVFAEVPSDRFSGVSSFHDVNRAGLRYVSFSDVGDSFSDVGDDCISRDVGEKEVSRPYVRWKVSGFILLSSLFFSSCSRQDALHARRVCFGAVRDWYTGFGQIAVLKIARWTKSRVESSGSCMDDLTSHIGPFW